MTLLIFVDTIYFLPASSGDTGDVDLIPGLVRSLEEQLSSQSSIPAWRIPSRIHIKSSHHKKRKKKKLVTT